LRREKLNKEPMLIHNSAHIISTGIETVYHAARIFTLRKRCRYPESYLARQLQLLSSGRKAMILQELNPPQ
jgi:hypothetical protein